MKRKRCPYCKILFSPDTRAIHPQKICGRPDCKKALKAENNAQWRKRNPGYFRNDYPRVKEWLGQHPDYLKKYRQTHPEYIKRNVEAQRGRDRRKKLSLDIQARIKGQLTDITNELWDLTHLDIQALKRVQLTDIALLLINLPCLDIQVSIDSPPACGGKCP